MTQRPTDPITLDGVIESLAIWHPAPGDPDQRVTLLVRLDPTDAGLLEATPLPSPDDPETDWLAYPAVTLTLGEPKLVDQPDLLSQIVEPKTAGDRIPVAFTDDQLATLLIALGADAGIVVPNGDEAQVTAEALDQARRTLENAWRAR